MEKWGETFLQGSGLALGLWLFFQPVLAALAVKGVLAEEMLSPAQWVLGLAAAFLGGRFSVRHSSLGTLVAGLGTAAVLVGMAMLLGLLLFGGPVLEESGIPILAAMLLGGTAAGLLPRRGKHRGRRPFSAKLTKT